MIDMKFQNEKGITLIALIITIIVLLILAGVSISLVIGDNGVLTQASDSVVKNREAKAREEVALAWGGVDTEYWAEWAKNTSLDRGGYFTAGRLNPYLTETGNVESVTPQGDGTYIVRYTAIDQNQPYDITIDERGNVVAISPVDSSSNSNTGSETGNETGNNTGSNTGNETASTGTPVSNSSYVGYYIQKGGQYAIIYVDLVGQTTYSGGALQYSNTSNSVTVPSSATSEKTFKSYVVTDTKYTDPNGHFGTNYVIEVAGNNTGTDDRFIAMALSDVDTNDHKWWNWFYTHSSSLGTSYEIGSGKTNTETVKVAWNDAGESKQNTDSGYTDIWSLITLDSSNKAEWFIPSSREWQAFGAMSWTDNATTPVTRSITGGTIGSGGNYGDNFGLSNYYWSSSQDSSYTNDAQGTLFSYSGMTYFYMNKDFRVRLSTTF